ncbi:GNAT family N-acetyltransferase [Paenibacillus dokdonensis]|uniref:GNAT family N-acetyltransferase n=1 Tax=Paenibacillus dokdonensis TaxID=2567944 RepID=UPI0010A79A17|nr:GNAT family protein [Paenibacillus dokdonensis]
MDSAKGYMLEAIQAIIRFGFEKMDLTKIDATVEPENIRSIRLMEKLGFEREQELKANLVYFYKSCLEQPLD